MGGTEQRVAGRTAIEPAAERHLSWNSALDLWLLAELGGLAVIVIGLAALDIGGLATSGHHVPIGVGWVMIYGLLAWYHRSIEAQVVRTDRLKQAYFDWVTASVVTLIGAFMLGDLPNVSRIWAIATYTAGVVTIWSVGAAARRSITRLSDRGTLGERIAIYGCTDKTDALIALIEGGAGPVAKVHLVFDQRNRGGRSDYSGMLPGNDLDAFISQIKERKIDTVVIDLPWSAGPRIDDLVECLEQINVNISMAPVSLDLESARHSIAYVGGRPTLSLYRNRVTGLQAIGKVAFDRTIAAIALLIL
ncbi:hypothetical protein, partial [uncultured Sphingomonas sp.]|uniref:hypothetical protein n=1 Tax=uncultured Sphingomonas sp. TaxID=158754 RepID=UPI0035CA236A